MPGKVRAQSPEVIAYADEHKIDMTMLNGSGANGAVTRDDVFRARVALQMDLPVNATAAEVLAVATHIGAQARRRKEESERARAEARARVAPPQPRHAGPPRGPAFALNPLVDQIRAQASARQSPTPGGAAPTLFAAGDTPSFTASGVPAASVLEVPWQARHALAAAPTAEAAYSIAAQCSGQDGAEMAERAYGDHDGNADYEQRVSQWRVTSMSNDELMLVDAPAARAELVRRESALPPDLPAEDEAAIDDYARSNLGGR